MPRTSGTSARRTASMAIRCLVTISGSAKTGRAPVEHATRQTSGRSVNVKSPDALTPNAHRVRYVNRRPANRSQGESATCWYPPCPVSTDLVCVSLELAQSTHLSHLIWSAAACVPAWPRAPCPCLWRKALILPTGPLLLRGSKREAPPLPVISGRFGELRPFTQHDGAFAKKLTFVSSSAKPPHHHELLHLEAEPGGAPGVAGWIRCATGSATWSNGPSPDSSSTEPSPPDTTSWQPATTAGWSWPRCCCGCRHEPSDRPWQEAAA
jgi:hypothetical protein